MPIHLLQRAKKRTVGTKQTLKAVDRGAATIVVVARDAEERVLRDLLRTCEQTGVTVLYAESMAELGRACGIEVGAAAAAVIEE